MKLIPQSWSFEQQPDGPAILRQLERAGRTCYKSETKITDDSAASFCRSLIKSGHHSVLEHASISVRIITNRGVSHEIVRHRLASYSQESTRYCNYSGYDIVFIEPIWDSGVDVAYYKQSPYYIFQSALQDAEHYYNQLISGGWSPQQAREVLPNALKTELVMTCNIREWRHFFTLRCSKAAHPQMRQLALSMLVGGFSIVIPVLFDDIIELYQPYLGDIKGDCK